ncbi:kita-kyushu lung cancer antigen 1 [Tamandua tetradactyla]|uniref:kita-kyushu lung cancer antigen 1 n=1 Tax=Tamandua tetradactyla TaxID=48850 RepID=UPI004053BE24
MMQLQEYITLGIAANPQLHQAVRNHLASWPTQVQTSNGSLLPNCQLSPSIPEKREEVINMFLLLMSSVILTFLFLIWKKRFQRNIGEASSNSTSLALVRPSSTGSAKRNTDNILSVNSLSQDILNNFPDLIAMQKQILVNLRILEYKLAELEHLLVIKGFNTALVNRKSTEKLTECNDSGGNH